MERYWPKTFDDYIEVAFRRRKQLLVPFMLVFSLAAASYPLWPRYYRATSLLTVDDDRLTAPLTEQRNNPKPNVEKKLKTLSLQLLSWQRLSELARQGGLISGAVPENQHGPILDEMRDRIEIKTGEADMVEVSFEDKNPLIAEKMANLLALGLIQQDRRARLEEGEGALQFIFEQLKLYREKLQNSESSFLVNKTRSELNDAINRRQILLVQMRQLEPTIASEAAREQSPAVVKLQAELAESEIRLNQLLLDAKKDHPVVEELTQRISELKRMLSQEMLSAAVNESSIKNPEYQRAALELRQLNLQIETLQRKMEDIKAGQVKMDNVSEQDVLAMERDKKVNEDFYKLLLMRLENISITKRMGDQGQGDLFEIVEPARAPEKPTKPQPLQVFGLGFVLAVLAGMGVAFLAEYVDPSLRNVGDAKDCVKLPLLAAVPRMIVSSPDQVGETQRPSLLRKLFPGLAPARPFVASQLRDSIVSPLVVTYHDPGSLPAEQYRLLRTQLAQVRRKRPVKTVLVTSALENEGKTTVASNLAVVMAKELNERILLVDADLRKGSVSQTLGVGLKSGLSDYLAGSVDLDRVMWESRVPRLTILPAGTLVANSTELLSAEKFAALLDIMRVRFETIIVDAPPALGLADVPVLLPHADATVLVVRESQTPRQAVRDMLGIMQRAQEGHVMGFVMTHVERRLPTLLQPYFVDAPYYQYGAPEEV